MVWTEITRFHHNRERSGYPSHYTDREWAIISNFLRPCSGRGRPRTHDLRVIWNAIVYIVSTGCQWRQLPKDFPPFTTVQHHFHRWCRMGVFECISHAFVQAFRSKNGHDEQPSTVIIDSQSVKTTESGRSRGYDAGKKVKGRKRHIAIDTAGNLLEAVVHEANIQDRDGAVPVLSLFKSNYPTVTRIYADGGYAGEKLQKTIAHLGELEIYIIKRGDEE